MEQIRQLLADTRPLKWIFSGDSITHGALHTFSGRDYTELFSERLRYEMARLSDIVIKTAISGRRVDLILEEFDWAIAQFAPDVVFLMIGMNDSALGAENLPSFRANMTLISEKLKALPGCHPILQTTCPIIEALEPVRTPHLPAYMEVVREVAAEQGLPLIDHTKYWQDKIAENPLRAQTWMNDAIHPNQWGHQAFAELIYRELGILDPDWPSARFFVP